MPKSFNEAYKQWRNQARTYSLGSVLNAAEQSLRHFESTPNYVPSAPWLTALAVKWVCQDDLMRSARAISTEEFDQLRQQLWQFPEEVETAVVESGLFMRRIIRPQLGFQQQASTSFLRVPLLLSGLESQHRLSRLFESKTQLSPADFMDLSFGAYSWLLNGNRAFTANVFQPLFARYGDAVLKYLDLVSADERRLKHYFSGLVRGARSHSEFYEFPALSRFPLLRQGDQYKCWDISLFFRGVEGLAHSILSEAGQDYSDAFSKLFEAHVVRESRNSGCQFEDEDHLRSLLPLNSKVPDGRFLFGSTSVYVESKAGIYSEPVMTAGTRDIFAHKTRSLQSAFVQASAAAAYIEPMDSERHLLVVTNVELMIGRGGRFESMLPQGELRRRGCDGSIIPFRNSYIISIDDYERLMALQFAGEISIPDFLRECVVADDDPQSSRLTLGDHMNRLGLPRRKSAFIQAGMEAVSRRLGSAFDVG